MPAVLFVEDDDCLRDLIAEALRDTGFVVIERKLAEEALVYLGQNTPDIILLDLGMPPGEMSGLELLARLREGDAAARIPVVVLSGFGDVVNRDVTGRLGVSLVLSKPASGADIARAIAQSLRSP
ncbi:MAG TPA: response regulator [Methylomirabilota bacterium]|jgi:CheY-like chemotaxis protein|nr:response regulator [Methylomirabilota bacterium]